MISEERRLSFFYVCRLRVDRNGKFGKGAIEMEEKKNLLTYEGLKALEDELHDLKVNRRKEEIGRAHV